MELTRLHGDRAADLAGLHALAFDAPWDAKAFAALLAGPGVFALGVERNGALAGLILMRAIAGEAEVLTLAVDPRARRQGLGRALTEAGLGLAAIDGAETAFLEVATDNPAAIALYRALGFTEAGRRPGYYARPGGTLVDAVLMKQLLRQRNA